MYMLVYLSNLFLCLSFLRGKKKEKKPLKCMTSPDYLVIHYSVLNCVKIDGPFPH